MDMAYNYWLVGLSYIVAVAASYCALNMARNVSKSAGSSPARIWLLCGSTIMGLGIWSMHFIGMLAMNMKYPVAYSIPITALSMLFAILSSAIALYAASGNTMTWFKLLFSGGIMGAGISLMHYTGMLALKISPRPSYDPLLFSLSVGIAVTASIAAMWIFFTLSAKKDTHLGWLKLAASIIMGAGISGMHYTGMAATILSPITRSLDPSHAVNNTWLAIAIAVISLILLGSTLIISMLYLKSGKERKILEAQSVNFFDRAGDLIYICNYDGKFLRVNPSLYQILGYSEEELMQTPLLETIHEDDRKFAINAMSKLQKSNTNIELILRLKHISGKFISVNWKLSPSEDGLAFYSVGRDLTETIKKDQALEQANKRLIKASRDAGKAEIAINVLHNIGNTLNSINISVEVVKESMSKSRAHSLIATSDLLVKHSDNLASYLNDDPKGKLIPEVLKTLSWRWAQEREYTIKELNSLHQHVEHIRKVISLQEGFAINPHILEKVDLKELVQECVSTVTDFANESRIELRYELESQPPILTDRSALQRILQGFINNSISRYRDSPLSEKPVVVKLTNIEGTAVITVSDFSTSIDEDQHFSIFAQSADKVENGDYLELHDCAVIAASLGIDLSCDSSGTDKGAVFTLKFHSIEPVKAA
ncbi:MAG: PAS domain S-box protein [Zhongshania sp.]|nr:PAS domain S-box protein [Zhongshania sp.]